MSLHFISGLPRSGSTLLAGILAQNPQIQAGVTSPVYGMTMKVLAEVSAAHNASFFDETRRHAVLRSVLRGYYYDSSISDVIDTNRGWCGQIPLIVKLYPDAKIICCVRNLGWVINSFERVARANPTRISSIYSRNPTANVYERAAMLMSEKTGIVSRAYACVKDAWYGEFANRLIVVDYDQLVNFPINVIESLYDWCGRATFKHDFECVEYESDAFDEDLGAPGLHHLSGPVRRKTTTLCIPADLFDSYKDSDFWRYPQHNVRGVPVLGFHKLAAVAS